MSTSACGEGGPNGAVGGLDDTSAPGAGECGAGKAHCKRYRRLAANGDFTGLAFVAAVESCMLSVEGRSAATPAARRGLWASQPSPTNQAFCSQHAAGERSAAPPSPPFCTSAPTAVRQCPLGSVLAGEQPDSSRSAAVSRSERSAQAPRPPLPALATDLTACSISRPSASKLSMINMVERNIKSWTTAARISRSERRSSQISRAAKDRCQSNSIRHRSLNSTRSFRMYRKRPLRAPCCCISRFGKSFPAVSASHNFSALLHPDDLIANSFTCSSCCLV